MFKFIILYTKIALLYLDLGLIIKRVQSAKNSFYEKNEDLKDIVQNIVKRRTFRITKLMQQPNILSIFSMITNANEIKSNLAKYILEELNKEDIRPSKSPMVHDILRQRLFIVFFILKY